MAGHFGCVSEFNHILQLTPRRTDQFSAYVNSFVAPAADRDDVPYLLRLDKPVEIYDYANTKPGDTLTIASSAPSPETDASKWTPSLPTDLGLLGDAMPGSDVVVVRYLDEDMISLRGMTNTATGDITLTAANAAKIVTNTPYGMTNCRNAGLFQVTGKTATTVNINAAPNVERSTGVWWPADFPVGIGTLMGRYHVVVYYVGQGVNGPSLKRKTLPVNGVAVASGADIALATAEEVVEGVENIQVILGVDNTTPRNDTVDAYVSPHALVNVPLTVSQADYEEALRKVNSMRVSLLMRSNEGNRNTAETVAAKIVGDVTVTPPADGRIRQVFDSLIAIRNRLRS